MGRRDHVRLRVAALALVGVSLLGATACGEGDGEDDEENGQVQEENGEEEEQ